ncbi:MAG TPA: ParB/RepB/Spo0J family partition protein [Patescibacteria group bacterium]|nr:ParB/RepB/Spo0J family partition protein [Patescibacteria group bacterium]
MVKSQPQHKKYGLGKGFSALISEDFDKSLITNKSSSIELIPLEKIQVNPQQPRRIFKEFDLNELADSIKQHGIIQPLLVSTIKNNKYTIIAGERRWRAAAIAKLKTVPVIIRSTKELEQIELAMIENIQRVDLNPLEQALGIDSLLNQFSMSIDEIAKKLGKAHSTVSNIARLLQLPEEAKKALHDGKISEGHARAILSLKDDPERQQYLLNTIIKYHWNVRQAERYVISIKEGVKENKVAHSRTKTESPATKMLAKILETQVSIKRMAYGGKLEISFDSDDDLDRIVKLIKKSS